MDLPLTSTAAYESGGKLMEGPFQGPLRKGKTRTEGWGLS